MRSCARASSRCCRTPICIKRTAMQIILLEKVINLGQSGRGRQSEGGLCAEFSDPAGQSQARDQGEPGRVREAPRGAGKSAERALTAAQERAAKLDGLMVQIAQKAGVDGKLFGSVTNSDIAEALKAQGFDVPKAAIRMPAGPIKQVGDHSSRSHCTPTLSSRSKSRCSRKPLSDSIETNFLR